MNWEVPFYVMMLCGTPSCRVSGVHGLGKRASGVDLSWETAMRESRNLQFMYIQYMNCVHMCSSCLLISRQKSLEYFLFKVLLIMFPNRTLNNSCLELLVCVYLWKVTLVALLPFANDVGRSQYFHQFF